MVTVESKVSREWPALGLKIQKGTNEFSDLSPVHRAMIEAYVSSGQMQILSDQPAHEQAPPGPLAESVEAEALASATGKSKTVLRKHTPPAKAEEPKAETPKASKPKPTES